MKRIGPTLLAFAALFLAPDTKDAPIGIQQVEAQSACTYIAYGAVLTAAQWQSCFQQKADVGLNGAFAPTPATANIVLYVATTGSDSNPGTSGSPFLTIQHAVNVAAGYNYQYQYTAAINVANGTYAGGVTLPMLVNYPRGQFVALTGNTTTPTDVVISNASGDAINTNSYAVWNIQGFQLKSTSGTGHDLLAQNYALIQLNHIDFAGNNILCAAMYYSIIYGNGGTFTSSTTSATYGIYAFAQSSVVTDGGTWTFNNSPNFTQYVVYISDYGIVGDGTFVNANTVTGNRLFMFGYSNFEYYATDRSGLPGNGTVVINQPSWFNGDSNTVLGAYQDTGTAATYTINLSDGATNLRADYNRTNAGDWTFSPVDGFLYVTSPYTTGTGFVLDNTSVGGHSTGFDTIGSAGGFGLSVGESVFVDITSGNVPWWTDTSANFNIWGRLGWGASSSGSYTVPTIDTGISRTAAATLAIGNGTAGDFSGTIKSAHVTATALANSATTSAVCYNTGTGVLTYDGTIGTCTTSDERLKNIGTRIDDALNKLLKINGFYFTWKNPKQYGVGRQIGVGAQTVEKVFPEAVATGSDGLKSVGYDKLVAPIIEALRELKADNDNMQHEIVALQRRAVRR